jgi:hypothetical protein
MKLTSLSLVDQIQPGSFEFALNHLLDEELEHIKNYRRSNLLQNARGMRGHKLQTTR